MEFADFFFHEHPLMLTETISGCCECDACGEDLSCPAYTCNHCEFLIHKTCAELPQTIQNPYHAHPLTLLTYREEPGFSCDACDYIQKGFSFHCGNCNFDLDIACALWKLTADESQDQLHHFTHFHPLVANEKHQEEDDSCDDIYCNICRSEANSNEVYGCDCCNYYLHRSCAELQFPPTLQHFYHPCLLTLCLDKQIYNYKCKACWCADFSYSYICKPCNFRFDISCALMPTIMESQGQQQVHHFGHGHPLKLVEIKHGDENLCSACEKRCCSGQTNYVCCSSKCKFSLHDSCFSLPKRICHPFHRSHPLTLYSLIQRQGSKPRCKVCYRDCSGFTYSCDICQFHMDVECPRMTSFIKYDGHPHNIFLVQGLDPCQPDVNYCVPCLQNPKKTIGLVCYVCGSELRSSEARFCCVECDYHLHLWCGPLPCFIKHESHPYCRLRLTNSPVIVEGEDKDTDEFYCDTCEQKRNPRLPIYYCSNNCAYIAELKCVISEVLLSLKGEYGEIELRSGMFKHEAGKVICKGIELAVQDSTTDSETEFGKLKVNRSLAIDDIIDALPEHEASEVQIIYERTYNCDFFSAYERDFAHSDECYAKFMAAMGDHPQFPVLGDAWPCNKLVNVGKHLIIPELAPIFEKLQAKYGDIVLESNRQSSELRTFFINSLCEVIKCMCIRRVADISEKELFCWWRYLRRLQHLGFKVEFALDRLKRVADAYYALQAVKTEKMENEHIDREIEKASQMITKWEAKLMELKEIRKSRELAKPASSSKVAECFKEASVLKWMPVGDDLL